ncbi:MAG: hypothetical protein E7672_03015 [Ruminococcaceae bacterium]|nr:hypothetical protein [Oscillospiraceae bacterium]
MNNTLYVKRFESVIGMDVTEDFLLPDYQPEVRRVIGVKSSVSIDGKYLSGDELEADGGVTYTLLYIGGDGAITQSSHTSSFTGHIPLGSDGDDRYSASDLIMSCSADNVTCRVTAPRKITLSSKVRLGLMSQKPQNVSLNTDITSVRRKTEKFTTASLCELRQTGEISGEIREREGVEIIFAAGDICISDVRIDKNSSNKAVVKGEGYITVLMFDSDNGYFNVKGRAPLEEEIILPDMAADATCRAAVFPSVVMIEVGVSDDGVVSWKMEYDLDIDVMKCTECEITTDAYLPESEEKLTMNGYSAYTPGGMINGRLTTSANMKIGADSSYICSWGSGSIDRCEIREGRMTLGGSAKISVVKSCDGDVTIDDVTIPIRYECEAMAGAENSDGALKRTKVGVTDINVRKDGDTLGITAELALSAAVLSEKNTVCATQIEAISESASTSKKNMVRVYVPDVDETPWDVEKKFRLGKEAKLEGEVYII